MSSTNIKTPFLALLLCLCLSFSSLAQTSIGLEAGFNFAGNIPSPQKTLFLRNLHPGINGGLFVEKHVSDKIAIRWGGFYAIRFFLGNHQSDSNFVNNYRAMHCVTVPVLCSFKASSKLSFDVGIEFITIVHSDIPFFKTPTLHLGPRAAIAYQITPSFAVRLYGVYDLIKIRQDNHPNSTNYNYYNSITLGLNVAYTFKRIKKRRVIRSPGLG